MCINPPFHATPCESDVPLCKIDILLVSLPLKNSWGNQTLDFGGLELLLLSLETNQLINQSIND